MLALDVANDEAGRWLWLAGGRATVWLVALELWDAESWHALVAAQARFARDTGALVQLQYALNFLAMAHLFAGELDHGGAAARRRAPDRGGDREPADRLCRDDARGLAGPEAQASELIEATSRAATARGLGRMVSFATSASSVLHNGLGRHDAAATPPGRPSSATSSGSGPLSCPSWPRRPPGPATKHWSGRARVALRTHRGHGRTTEWALGIQARVRALLSEGEAADRLYRESIDRLGRPAFACSSPAPPALRRVAAPQRRRLDARAQLRTAHDLLEAMGVEAFSLDGPAASCRPPARPSPKRTVDTSGELTAQEAVIAGWPATGCRTRRSAPGCSSAPARSSTTWARSSPSSPSPPQPAAPSAAPRPSHHQAGVARRPAGVPAAPPAATHQSRWPLGGCERRPAPTRLGGPRARCRHSTSAAGSDDQTGLPIGYPRSDKKGTGYVHQEEGAGCRGDADRGGRSDHGRDALRERAATPQCGPNCIRIFSAKFGTYANPNFVETVFRGGKVGQPTILARPSSSNPAGISSPGFQRGLVFDFAAGWCPPR